MTADGSDPGYGVSEEIVGVLPDPVAALVRERLSATLGATPATARPAATVLLLRDTDRGLEVLLQRRSRSLAFAGGMTVFPGGAVEPSDEIAVPWVGGGPRGHAAALFASEDETRALLVAAVRETYEEVGVLLARPPQRAAAVVPEWRARLERREVALTDLLGDLGLALDASALVPWSAWVTPEGEPRRYDTRFLACELPPGQAVDRTTRLADEAVEAWWSRPQEALDRAAEGEITLMPPTTHTLDELAAAPTVDAALRLARSRAVRRFVPRFVVDNGTGAVRVVVRTESAGGPAAVRAEG